MLKTTGLIAGHYECRSLAETLPVFTDLLAMEIVEQKPGVATLKHPNTAWRLIVHEGGPNAPEKTFDNHYGFRVARHEEVEAAWKYIEAHKDQYHLSKITKPQSAHFAYSIYFREPGGNHLEIEYYNPGGAQHGRAHTAGHWDQPLPRERFAGRGYVPQAFTHGTLQCDDIERSRRFYVEVLGLEIAAGFNMAQYIKHLASPWYIVVLQRKPRQYLAPMNRFTLGLGSAGEVEQAHRDFSTNGGSLGITEVGPLESSHASAHFIFSDVDKNWWELTTSV
ncbi:MAG TPA: VOC family protein [Terriglobales bacterium]|jgi:catechol 2,3-dioxygenase-like lactoylglutathione lyase family enzyme|nr:VOC family protein [Terriglobales bacterium]